MTEIQSLELTIRKVRAVNSATIPIAGLTVLCGNNSTGKTTIAKILQDIVEARLYFHGIYRLNLLKDFQETLIEPLFNAAHVDGRRSSRIDIPHMLQTTAINDLDVDSMLNHLHALRSEVENVFKANSWSTLDTSSRFCTYLLDALHLTPQATRSRIEDSIRDEFDRIENEIRHSSEIPFTAENFRKCSLSSDYLWRGDVEIKEQGDVVLSYNGENVRGEVSRFASVNRILFLQSPFESENPRDFWKPGTIVPTSKHHLFVPNHALPFRYERDPGRIEANDIDGLLADLIGGNIVLRKDSEGNSPQWQFVREDKNAFPLEESASGIRSLSALMRLYAYGLIDEKTILVLDEPEVHLHPKWIVGYARVLVELVRHKHVRVLLASHSPDMVYALKAFALAADIASKTHFCQATKNPEDEYSYDFVDRGTNVGTIFDSFNEVTELIESISDKLRGGA